jgi:hypothetical protein
LLSFHRVREAIAAKMVIFIHIDGRINPADILSKHWGHQQVWENLQPLLFWSGDTLDTINRRQNRAEESKSKQAKEGSSESRGVLDFPQDRSADTHDCGTRLGDGSRPADVLAPSGHSDGRQTVRANAGYQGCTFLTEQDPWHNSS